MLFFSFHMLCVVWCRCFKFIVFLAAFCCLSSLIILDARFYVFHVMTFYSGAFNNSIINKGDSKCLRVLKCIFIVAPLH